jgi:hypothetical protein
VVNNKGNEMYPDQVEVAFDKMEADLKSLGWSEEYIQDREFFLNMIRTCYDKEYLESIGHKSTL